jgi:hypothetical protein
LFIRVVQKLQFLNNNRYYSIAVEKTMLALEGRLKTRPMNKPIYDPKNPKINLEYEFISP